MKVEDTLTTILRHHLWANLQLLECCATLPREQLDATMVGAYGSIYETLEHFVRSEKSYLWRITTGTPYIKSEHTPLVTIAEMTDSVRATGEGLIEWAPKLKPDDLIEVDWEGRPRAIPKTIMLTQALFHAAEHREQIKTMLTQIGVEPPDLQGWEFFDQNYAFEAMP